MEDTKKSLEDIIGEPEEKPQTQPLDETSEESIEEEKKQDEELQKKQEQLSNLNKAINEANTTLQKVRKVTKIAKQQVSEDDDDEVPKIDMSDPSSRAWDKHIKGQVQPLQSEFEKEKQEIRTFAIKRFLEDKPNLVKDQEALKRVIETYDKIKIASERTVEGVLIDLDRAYASENYEDLLVAAGQKVSAKAKAEAEFSEIAVSRGSTSYPSSRGDKMPPYTKEDDEIVRKWGYEGYKDYYNKVIKKK